MNKKNLMKGTLLGFVGLIFICMNTAIAVEPCTIEIDGNIEYVEYGAGKYVYSEENSCSHCNAEYVYCYNAGEYLGSGYSGPLTVVYYPDSNISYTLNDGYPTAKLFTGVGTITISDGETTITMLDRNLGATLVGTGCEGWNCSLSDPTAGYHFQWGNNYGFDPYSIPDMDNTQIQSGSLLYDPLHQQYYSNSTLIIDNNNRLNDSSVIDLWGGNTGDNEFNLEDETWKVNNPTDRRGPCPENFHVPSIGELSKIDRLMGINGRDVGSVDDFLIKLLIPRAGVRDPFGKYDSYYYSQYGSYYHYDYANGLGSYAYLWSSSPESGYEMFDWDSGEEIYYYSDNSQVFQIDRGPDDWDPRERAYGHSVRCVYDSYETYTPTGNLSSEGGDSSGGDSKIIVSIAALNSGNNTCTGENYIFPAISASPRVQTMSLSKKFQCVFGKASQSSVTLLLSGDLTDENGNVISGENVKLKNPEWTSQPTVLKNGSTAFNFKTFMGLGATLFNKVGNKIGTAEGSGVEIEITVPGGTPDGTYNGTLVLTY